MLANQYRSSDSHAELRPALARVANNSGNLSAVGAYNNGILMVVDEAIGTNILDRWRWLVDESCFVLMTTGFGDVFFWNPENGINHLKFETQRATVEFVDAEIEWFLGGIHALLTMSLSATRLRNWSN